MRVCGKSDALRAWLAAWMLGLALAAGAEFRIAEIQPKLIGDSLQFAGTLDLAFTPKVEEALAKGIELTLVIDVKLNRVRRFWWGQNLGRWALRRSIRFHALAGQYLVSDPGESADNWESFTVLADALKYLGALNELKLTLPEAPPAGDYSVDLRVGLDIEALPTPLRPVAYTSLSWRLNSGWTTWGVAR